MASMTKKKKNIQEKVSFDKLYNPVEAIALLREFASTKFKESVDVSINLGVDPQKSNQVVRSSTKLPKGTGKTIKVIVFAQGNNADKAKNAGADLVGFKELADDIKANKVELNGVVIISTPDAMPLVGQLGQILGPRGLMPNPKVGTVTMEVEKAVSDAKGGQVRYRTDKKGIIHCAIGNISFSAEDIIENLTALLADLRKLKPASSKGVYLKKIYLSSTMGPGIPIDISSI